MLSFSKKHLLILLLLLGLGSSHTSQAYNRTRTNTGVPIFWGTPSIKYYIGQNGSKDLTDGSDIQAIKHAFSTWKSVPCADIPIFFGGLVPKPKAEVNPNEKNQNHIFWVEPPQPWPFPSGALAVTTLKWQITGEIIDADMRFNGHDYQWSTSPTPPKGKQDILNTATHEAGHFLGLDHSSGTQKDATMAAQTEDGETKKRDLASDDKAGICAIYPKKPATLRFKIVSSALRTEPCHTRALPNPSSKQPKQGCQSLDTPNSFFFFFSLFILCPLCTSKNRLNMRSNKRFK